ncbi:MAG: NAD+ synthase (glutamine-hydrolyzing), partial [Yoonia sp.]
MKIGIAQINTTVGDLVGNKTLILNAYQALVAEGSELIVFPELAICGYPPRDLLFKSRFVSDIEATLQAIAAEIGAVPAVIGTVEARPATEAGRPFYNAAAWCENGAIQTMARKCLLPSYDVFDEDRYFEPALTPVIHEWNGKRIGLTICEDIWTAPSVPTNRRYNVDPLTHFAEQGIDLLLNLSASPWHDGKNEAREPLLQFAADRCNCT